MAINAMPRRTPKINPKDWSSLPNMDLLITLDNNGVKKDAINRTIAKTAAKDAMIDNSQLSPKIGPTIGISLIKGITWGEKTNAAMAATTQPTIAITSRTRPRE